MSTPAELCSLTSAPELACVCKYPADAVPLSALPCCCSPAQTSSLLWPRGCSTGPGRAGKLPWFCSAPQHWVLAGGSPDRLPRDEDVSFLHGRTWQGSPVPPCSPWRAAPLHWAPQDPPRALRAAKRENSRACSLWLKECLLEGPG